MCVEKPRGGVNGREEEMGQQDTIRTQEIKQRRKKILLSLGAVAMVGAVVGGGTYATFNAQTANPGNVWANGTLVLSNKVAAGTTCLSTGAGTGTDTNVNNNCDALFTGATLRKPNDSATVAVNVKNEGSLDASALKLYSSACTPGDTAGETYKGTGDPCDKVQLYVQRWTDAARTVPAACVYGSTQLVTPNTCDFAATGAEGKTLGAFATANNSTTPLSLGALNTGVTGYYTVGVKLPQSTSNAYQGRRASVDFTWTLEQ
jgi:predicted ribosomally synthesized peptide with SipW-like signal peptide